MIALGIDALLLMIPVAWFIAPRSGPGPMDFAAAYAYSLLLFIGYRLSRQSGSRTEIEAIGDRSRIRLRATYFGHSATAWLIALALVGAGAAVAVRMLDIGHDQQRATWVRVGVDGPAPPAMVIRYGPTADDESPFVWQPYTRTLVVLRSDGGSLAGARVEAIATDDGPLDLQSVSALGATFEAEAGALRVTDAGGALLRWPAQSHRLAIRLAGGSGRVTAFWLDRQVTADLGGDAVGLNLALPYRWQGWALLPRVAMGDVRVRLNGARDSYRLGTLDVFRETPQSLIAGGIGWRSEGCSFERAADHLMVHDTPNTLCVLRSEGIAPWNLPSRVTAAAAWFGFVLLGIALLAAVAWFAGARARSFVEGSTEGPTWQATGHSLSQRRRVMLIAFAIAAAWQIAYAVTMPLDFSLDSITYYRLAQAFAADPRLSSQEFFRTPGYPMFLAGLSWLFGRSALAIAISQHLLIALLAPLVVWTASERRLPLSAGLAAGLMAGIAPVLSVAASILWTESLFAVLAAAALLVFAAHHDRRSRLVLAGMLGGGATLVRPNGLFILLLFVTWLLGGAWLQVGRAIRQRMSMIGAAMVCVGYLVIAAPMHLNLALARHTADLSQGWAGTIVWMSGVMQGWIGGDLPAQRPDGTAWARPAVWEQNPYVMQDLFPEMMALSGPHQFEWFREGVREGQRMDAARYQDYLYATSLYNLTLRQPAGRSYAMTGDLLFSLAAWPTRTAASPTGTPGTPDAGVPRRYPPISCAWTTFHAVSRFVLTQWHWLAWAALLAWPLLALRQETRPLLPMGAFWLAQVASSTLLTWGVDRFVIVAEPVIYIWTITAGVVMIGLLRAVWWRVRAGVDARIEAEVASET